MNNQLQDLYPPNPYRPLQGTGQLKITPLLHRKQFPLLLIFLLLRLLLHNPNFSFLLAHLYPIIPLLLSSIHLMLNHLLMLSSCQRQLLLHLHLLLLLNNLPSPLLLFQPHCLHLLLLLNILLHPLLMGYLNLLHVEIMLLPLQLLLLLIKPPLLL